MALCFVAGPLSRSGAEEIGYEIEAHDEDRARDAVEKGGGRRAFAGIIEQIAEELREVLFADRRVGPLWTGWESVGCGSITKCLAQGSGSRSPRILQGPMGPLSHSARSNPTI